MKWEKLKTFLIVLFLGINIFLVTSMILANRAAIYINKDTISDTVNILKSNGILIDKKTIMRSVDNVQNIDITNIIFKKEFTDNLKDTNLTIGTNDFTYTLSDISNITMKNYQKEVKKILKSLGIDTKSIIFSNVIDSKDGITIDITNNIKKYTLFDNQIQISIKGNTATISGRWHEPDKMPKRSKNNKREMVYITSVLIGLVDNPIMENTSKTIANIEFGFKIQSYDSGVTHKTQTTVPCYKISLSDGNILYYHARTGEYLN